MAASETQVRSCIVKIDGKTQVEGTSGGGSSPTFAARLESVQVDKRLDAPDMFLLDLDLRQDAQLLLVDDLKEGKTIEILLGPVGAEKQVFKGEIDYIEPHYRHEGTSTLLLGGYDPSHRLTRGTSSKTWGDGVQQQDLLPTAVRDVINNAQEVQGTRDGLSARKVDVPRARTAYIPQFNVSDWHFIRWLGQDVDRVVDADAAADPKQLSFAPPDVNREPRRVLVREAPRGEKERLIKEARFQLNTVRQVSRVEVRGWDPKHKKAIVGTATDAAWRLPGKPGWEATGEALYGKGSAGKVLTITDRPVDSQEEAEAIAKAVFTQLSLDYLTAEIDYEGDPEVTAGDIVEVRGFGKRFDGRYLVAGCTQEMVPRTIGYVTHLRLARNTVAE
ncbi:MAG TPA: hypothetical protein PLQ97_05515 [Myxococcota bacterium]|nr:hypothetical protein [Myxococcota bacterium]HQK50120.1 hypothetical protein [Myxococcota bacterium]